MQSPWLRPDSLGVTENVTYFRDVKPDVVTLPQHFRRHGYETVFVGKIYHGRMTDKEQSWSGDPTFGPRYSPRPLRGYQLPTSRATVQRNAKEVTARYGPEIARSGLIQGPVTECADVPDNAYKDGVTADAAVLTLRKLKDKPFFLAVGFHKPHLPFIAPKKYWDLYNTADLELADNPFKPKDAPSIGLHASFELRTREGVPKYGPIGDELARHLLHAYLACVSYVDAQVGKVLDELDRLGLRENTIIILWGDHGWHLGEHGIWGKATNYEIGTRVPLIVVPPGGQGQPARTDTLVELLDMYPTLCEMADLPLPAHLEGQSFAPLLAEPTLPGKEAVLSQFPCPALREWAAMPLSQGMRETWFGPLIRDVESQLAQESPTFSRELYENHLMGYAMRTDRYRLVLWVDTRTHGDEPIAVELYDHEKDPQETVNLAVTEQHAGLVRTLTAQLQALRAGSPRHTRDQTGAARPIGLRDTVSLDETWEIIFDDENQGREAGWHDPNRFAESPHKRPIPVPSCWEEHEKDYEGVAWYRRDFTVPADWAGRIVRLHFDAVNFQTEVWLNNQSVGFHQGGFTPFEFRVDEMLEPGEINTLTMRVAGPILMTNRRIEGIGKMETPQWRGAITGGIWQPVRLIATGRTYIDDVFVKPRITDDVAAFDVALQHSGDGRTAIDAELTVCPVNRPDETVARRHATLELDPGITRLQTELAISDARYWSPDDPHLYRATLALRRDGIVLDRFTTRFGMREFTIRDGRFHLNGKPMFLKATFFEGLYSVRLAYPDSREMAAREIRLAKEAGFNMIRPWRKPPPPMWLDLADEMGVLTVGSLAIECMDFPIQTPRLPGWVVNEVRRSILRDRNRACVVQWELFNELKRPVLKQLLHRSAMLARELDPTRLILDESGGWAQGANMYLPYQTVPTRFNDIHHYPGQQINDETYEKLRWTAVKTPEQMRTMGLAGRLPGRNVVNGLMTYFSELGYGSMPDLVANNRLFEQIGNPIVPPTVYHRRLADQYSEALRATGFDSLYPDLKQFCLDQQVLHGIANKRMIEAVRTNPMVVGYCVHALTAGDWIIGAGLLDLFRNPKTYAYEGTKAANQLRIVSIRARPRNVYAERGAMLSVTGVNELDAVDARLTVAITAADGTVVYSRTVEAAMAHGITDLFVEDLDASKLHGTYEVKATVTAPDGKIVTENTYPFDVFTRDQLRAPEGRIAVLDLNNSLRGYLKRAGIEFGEFAPEIDRSLPVFVSLTQSKTPEQRKMFADLTAFIKAGGTGVYLGGGGPHVNWGSPIPASRQFPLKARIQRAAGHWMCIPRLVREHPIFDGLPSDCMMGAIYENVLTDRTLRDLPGEPIVASIGFPWFPEMDRLRRHYYGPGDVWHGADMAEVSCGQGRVIVSHLRLIEHLGRDPVADRILLNTIRYAQKQSRQCQSVE